MIRIYDGADGDVVADLMYYRDFLCSPRRFSTKKRPFNKDGGI